MTAPYLPERPYVYPGPPRTPAEWAEQALAAKDAEIAALRDDFRITQGALADAQEAIARLRAEATLWEAYDTRTRYQRDKAEGEVARLRTALAGLLERYVDLVNCGDCGNWDPETEEVVIQGRAALAPPAGP